MLKHLFGQIFFIAKLRNHDIKTAQQKQISWELNKCTRNKDQLAQSVFKNAVMAMDKNFKIKIKYQCTFTSDITVL